MKELFDEISKRLNCIDFEYIWPGFCRYEFAIYTSEKVQFKDKEIPWNNNFIGNTSINYNGKYIAIWNVGDSINDKKSMDIDVLASNIVHEMFHAFQYENGEKRFPNDLLTLSYPQNFENFSLKYQENKLLVEAFEEQELTKKRELLNYFAGIRFKRESIIGNMCQCEYLTETVEGTAEYVGTMALKMLSESKYFSRVKSYMKLLYDFTSDQLNIRHISYYIGTILLLVANDANISIRHSIKEENKPIFEIIAKSLSPKSIEVFHYEEKIKLAMDEIQNSHKKEIEFFLNGAKLKKSGNFYISGYDPMNMIRVDDYILCKTYVRLTDECTREEVIFMGETLLQLYKESSNKVYCYYR